MDIALFCVVGGESGGMKRGCLWKVEIVFMEVAYALGEWAIVFMGVKEGVYPYVSRGGKG